MGRKLTAAERELAARQSREFVRLLKNAIRQDNSTDISGPGLGRGSRISVGVVVAAG